MNDDQKHPDTESLHRRLADLDDVIGKVDELLADDGDTKCDGRLISFIVPVKDERDTIQSLCHRIACNVPPGNEFEIILIDDGSQDDSWTIIDRLTRSYPKRIRGIRFRHNAGKATALAAGFRIVQGKLVFTLDADLQDDPQEIPRFLDKIDEGYDLVSGWKRTRHDPWHKVLPSRVFNLLASALGGVWLHDHNCGFKCYRAALVERLKLHGELHRMIPSMAGMHGFRCAEIEVKHHPRRSGRSKYGMERFLRGFCDIITIGFLRRFQQRPSHFFNTAAGLQLGIAMLLAVAGVWGGLNTTRGVACVLMGGVFAAVAGSAFLIGLLAELIIRGPLNVHDELPVVCDTGFRARSSNSRSTTTPPREVSPLRTHPISTGQPTLFNIERQPQHPAAH
jgi:glycosyltransferase involved in cell wall biosynthesis